MCITTARCQNIQLASDQCKLITIQQILLKPGWITPTLRHGIEATAQVQRSAVAALSRRKEVENGCSKQNGTIAWIDLYQLF
jgi:hypothetical protein